MKKRSEFIKEASRLSDMLSTRRQAKLLTTNDLKLLTGQDRGPGFLRAEHNSWGSPLVINHSLQPGDTNLRHELTHLYQTSLPDHAKTPGEFLADRSDKILGMKLPLELGAVRSQLSKYDHSALDVLRAVARKAGSWRSSYSGDPSFTLLHWLNKKFNFGDDLQLTKKRP